MHRPFEPFKLHSCGSGQFLGFVRNDGVRFDERLLTSEDNDIQLQSIAKYHKLLKIDRYYLKVRQWTNSGGYQAIRDGRNTDRKYRELLVKKWGGSIIRVNDKQKSDVGYSIHVPLLGS